MISHLRLSVLVGSLLVGCTQQASPLFDQPVAHVVRACEPRSAAPFLLNEHVLVSDSEGNIPADRHHGDFAVAFRTSGSLLMWIDEMYDVPKTPEDKVFGFWPTAKSARRMFGLAAQEHMLYRVFSRPQAGEGMPTNPIEHGQFNEDDTCFWRPGFWGVADTSWAGRYGTALPAQALQPCGERHEAPLPNQVPPAAE